MNCNGNFQMSTFSSCASVIKKVFEITVLNFFKMGTSFTIYMKSALVDFNEMPTRSVDKNLSTSEA